MGKLTSENDSGNCDNSVEEWLRDQVVPTYDRVMRGEEKLIPAAEVFAGAQARYRARKMRTNE
jgi:hypothetical protein